MCVCVGRSLSACACSSSECKSVWVCGFLKNVAKRDCLHTSLFAISIPLFAFVVENAFTFTNAGTLMRISCNGCFRIMISLLDLSRTCCRNGQNVFPSRRRNMERLRKKDGEK